MMNKIEAVKYIELLSKQGFEIHIKAQSELSIDVSINRKGEDRLAGTFGFAQSLPEAMANIRSQLIDRR